MKKSTRHGYYLFAFRVFAELFGTMLVPAVLAVFIKYLLDLSTIVFLGILGVSFVFSMFVIVKKISAYGREFEQIGHQKD